MKTEKLKVGNSYWIFTGMMKPVKMKLTDIVNDGRTAIFDTIPRKVTSVYMTKGEAMKNYKY